MENNLLLSFMQNILARKNTNKKVLAELIPRGIKGKLMLNFLYKVPLITRVKTTNGKVGRKYANYEQLS